jgi:hypothetical protein
VIQSNLLFHKAPSSALETELEDGDGFQGDKVEVEESKMDQESCKGHLTNLGRELHFSLAKGNPKRTL